MAYRNGIYIPHFMPTAIIFRAASSTESRFWLRLTQSFRLKTQLICFYVFVCYDFVGNEINAGNLESSKHRCHQWNNSLTIPLWEIRYRSYQSRLWLADLRTAVSLIEVMCDDGAMIFAIIIAKRLKRSKRTCVIDRNHQDPFRAASREVPPHRGMCALIRPNCVKNLDLGWGNPCKSLDNP